jgi:hypothetical protein
VRKEANEGELLQLLTKTRRREKKQSQNSNFKPVDGFLSTFIKTAVFQNGRTSEKTEDEG